MGFRWCIQWIIWSHGDFPSSPLSSQFIFIISSSSQVRDTFQRFRLSPEGKKCVDMYNTFKARMAKKRTKKKDPSSSTATTGTAAGAAAGNSNSQSEVSSSRHWDACRSWFLLFTWTWCWRETSRVYRINNNLEILEFSRSFDFALSFFFHKDVGPAQPALQINELIMGWVGDWQSYGKFNIHWMRCPHVLENLKTSF